MQNNQMTHEAFRQAAIAVIFKLEKCAQLTPEEQGLKREIQHHGQT